MRKTKILFIALGELSSGELTIAYEFAARLSPEKFEARFLLSERGVFFIKDKDMDYLALNIDKGAKDNRQIIDSYIKEFDPDFFFVSDVYTMEYASGWSGIDFQMLKSLKKPVIGVDEYQYTTAGYSLDYYGGLVKSLPSLIEQCDYLVRNCPSNTKRSDSSDKVKYFSLFARDMTLQKSEKAEIRKKLGLDEKEKLVFITSSRWEMLNYYGIQALGMLIKWVPLMLKKYLESIEGNITVMHVGSNPWSDVDEARFKYIHFGNLSQDEFEKYLLASDLYITNNVVSVTLSKAVFGRVPCVVLQNRKIVDFSKIQGALQKMPEWYGKMAREIKIAYPFRAGSFGWFKFLETAFENNSYSDTFKEVQLFKFSEVVEALRKQLFDIEEITNLKARQETYLKEVLSLPTPEDIMYELIKSENLTL